jgi:type VI secretion system secreted protein VgrG
MGVLDRLSGSSTKTLSVLSKYLPTYLGKPAFGAVSLKGTESVNELFEYTLRIKSLPNVPLDIRENLVFNDINRTELTLCIELDGSGTFVPGSIGSFGQSNLGAGQRFISTMVAETKLIEATKNVHVYEFTLRPWFWLATQVSDCKIYQNKNVLEVLKELFNKHKGLIDVRLSPYIRPQVYPRREQIIQFNETDFDFIARLCEEWGINWWFEHKAGTHTLVLSDNNAGFKPNPDSAYQRLNYYPPGHKVDEEYIEAFAVGEHFAISEQWSSRDEDYTRSRSYMDVSKSTANAKTPNQTENFHYPSGVAQPKAGAGGIEGSGNDIESEKT